MNELNVHNVMPISYVNGPGKRFVIWTQGCPRSCAGCFNPDSQSFIKKEIISVDELYEKIISVDGIEGATISGGEPFSQACALSLLMRKVHDRGLSVICYTGYELEEIKCAGSSEWNLLLNQIDLLIDGPFVNSEKCLESMRGSSNQRLHFLSDRIDSSVILNASRSFEITIDCEGSITQTGFPDVI
ncbi:4Fe-4S single cluster domain-containing protein [Patescibacteria group bacterium]